MNAKCRLSEFDRPLRESHILPNFAFKEATEFSSHPRIVVSAKPRTPTVDKSRQTGVKDYLLCQECESKLSKWEPYACKTLWMASTAARAVRRGCSR